VSRSAQIQRALPLAVLVLVAVCDVALGRDQQLLSLVVMSPLLAASAFGRRATLGYGLLALVVAVLLGIYDRLYTPEALPAQLIRLAGVALGAAAAVVASTLRLRQEEQLAGLSAQAATSRAVVQMAEALQRSLLVDVPPVPGLRTAVRYQPAARHAEVGGDWYDVFPLPGGSTMFVIGDVAGHDVPAATTMAQARGMLRGIAQSVDGSPAAVLTSLDRALATLSMTTPVTATVAVLEPADSARPPCLTWSNAGHPAPVLIGADGTAMLLERPPERLLGVSPETPRTDHEVPVCPGDTVLFYTDGLIERRDVALDEGTAWLLGAVERLCAQPLDGFCDGLLAELPGRVEDDVALLAVRLSD
jgi:phosphoserine phosphatase RsbU/P